MGRISPFGTVNLTPRTQHSRLVPSSLACEGGTGHITQGGEGAIAGSAVLTGREAMATEPEMVVDRAVGGEKLLGVPD
jgi:hypothetical protein